jgi:hypothetical protein
MAESGQPPLPVPSLAGDHPDHPTQDSQWLVGRRYLSETSMTLVLAAATDHDRDREEHKAHLIKQLQALGYSVTLQPAA